MAKLYNLARMTTATTGTGTITLGSAVSGFLTFTQSGVIDGETVAYSIRDGANSESGAGTYTFSGTTLTRTVATSTNGNAAISLSGAAQVFITALREDIANLRENNLFTGTQYIGAAGSARVIDGFSSTVQVASDGSALWGQTFINYGNHSSPVGFATTKTRNASPSSHTAVQSGDKIFQLAGYGDDGANSILAGLINLEVDGTPGTNDMPGRWVFQTTADGSNSSIERLRIDNAGRLISAEGTGYAGDSANTEQLQIHSLTNSGIGAYRYASNAASGARIQLWKSRNTTIGSHTAVASGDTLGVLQFGGSDGTNYQTGSLVRGTCDGAVSGGDVPSGLTFNTSTGGIFGTERMRIASSGLVNIGNGGVNYQVDLTDAQFQITTSGTSRFGLQLTAFVNGSVSEDFCFAHSRSNTFGTQAVLSADDRMGRILFYGSDGTGFIRAAVISAEVDATPGTNDMPARLVFSTTADGASSPTERMRINSDGQLIMAPGSVTPATLSTNSTYTLTPTSNTNFRISFRGTDGTTRVGNITLA